jgi:hypothetical protein
VNNGHLLTTASLNLSFIRPLFQTATFFRSQGRPLYTGLTVYIFNIIYFNLTSQYNKWMKLSNEFVVWKKGDESFSIKMPSWVWVRIAPRSSRIGVVCSTDAHPHPHPHPLHIHIIKNLVSYSQLAKDQKFFKLNFSDSF